MSTAEDTAQAEDELRARIAGMSAGHERATLPGLNAFCKTQIGSKFSRTGQAAGEPRYANAVPGTP